MDDTIIRLINYTRSFSSFHVNYCSVFYVEDIQGIDVTHLFNYYFSAIYEE